MLAPLLLAALVAATSAAPRRGSGEPAARNSKGSRAIQVKEQRGAAARAKAVRPPPAERAGAARREGAAPTLARARAALRDVQRDRSKRRSREAWERAIRGLERAARGKDTAPALLDAARARYALYRFSQVEADRAAALRLAERARRAGAAEARVLAAAIRREAGEEERPARKPAEPARARPQALAKAPAKAAAGPGQQARPPAPAIPAAPLATADEAPSTDPVLDAIVARLAAEAAAEAAPPAAEVGAPAPAEPPAEPPDAPAAPLAALDDDPALRRIIEQLRAPAPRAAEEGGRGPVRRIVIDAGHGGHDTGAIGPTNVREKDVVLAIARRLARRLRDAGFEVVLTRDDDRYLPLDRRTEIANGSGADLLVSIHANAHPRRDRRGVETYVLDLAHDRYAKRIAARENGALDDDELPEVRRILGDLDAKASAGPSRRLAEAVQRELAGAIRARFGEVRDLGVKSALFYVLLGARMPAVLVETSFLSNRVEERRLASPRFQEDVAAGIARAVGTFAAEERRVAAR
jgi:N-acetylmuramoyl-L-alanine amidase